jgi:hypothetical protein
MNIGDILTRDDGTKWRLVGVQNGCWTAAPADGFGGVIVLSADDLTTRFEGAAGPPESGDEQTGWKALAERYAKVAIAVDQPGPSPEQRFAAVAKAKGRK